MSVLADGSTDSSIEQEIVFVRFVQYNKAQMVKYNTVKQADAPGVLRAIDSPLDSVGIDQEVWQKKAVCAKFDGAAVMMGQKTGVAASLKERVPHTVVCIAHRLELAVLDAVKNVPYLHIFEETMKTAFKMYYYKKRDMS